MMELKEIQQLLQRYFKGESTDTEERKLEAYFGSGNVVEEVAEYSEFFGGVSELANTTNDTNIENDVMDYILENETQDKTRYLGMWKMITGIAASIIIVLGGFLFYQEQQKPFKDSFDNPDEAYAYATKTLGFVSGKYNKGLAQFSQFEKLRKANNPVKKGTAPIVQFYKGVERLQENSQSQLRVSEVDSL